MSAETTIEKNSLYALIKEVKPKQEFEDEIKQLQQDYDGLLDEDAAAYLVVDKLGYNKANVVSLSDVHPGQEVTVQGIVTGIQEPRSFTKKNGRTGKVATILLSDDTGMMQIVLWNDDVSRIDSGEIQPKMALKIINGYTKQGRNGVEVHVGRWSTLTLNDSSEKPFSKDELVKTSSQSPAEQVNTVKGTILSISSTNVFFKKDETYGFVCKVHVKTNEGIKLITVWDTQVKNLQQFNQGDTVEFSYLDMKMNNDEKEYHANGKAVLTKC